MKNYFYFVIIAVLFFAPLSYCSYKSNQEDKKHKARLEAYKAQEEACVKSPSCQDSRAKKLSKDEKRVVQSTTGNFFLYGKLCPNKCVDFIAGYNWAEKRGISKEYGCIEHSGLFREGCLGYIEDRIGELSTDNDAYYEYNLEQTDCIAGRYGDC